MYKLKISKDDIKKYDYKTVKISGFKKLKEIGLPDNYFGGRVHRVVTLRDESNLLIIDELHRVIGVLEPEKKVEEVKPVIEEVKIEVVEEYKEIFPCDKCGKEFDTKLKVANHRRFCKVGGEENG